MRTINSIIALIIREFRIAYRNFSDILSIFIFFLLGIIIFVFSVGPDKDIFSKIGIGIIWTLLLLSNNLSLKKFYQDDFDNGNIILLHMSGLSYEIITLIKFFCMWFLFQLPFFIIIPIAIVLLDINIVNIELIFFNFLIGSPILTLIVSISASMNLLNTKNFSLGSLIVMILSIPIIIFSVNIVDASQEIIEAQIKILLAILFFFLAITPWICASCIKLALQNK